jgi:hypothetical protein
MFIVLLFLFIFRIQLSFIDLRGEGCWVRQQTINSATAESLLLLFSLFVYYATRSIFLFANQKYLTNLNNQKKLGEKKKTDHTVRLDRSKSSRRDQRLSAGLLYRDWNASLSLLSNGYDD